MSSKTVKHVFFARNQFFFARNQATAPGSNSRTCGTGRNSAAGGELLNVETGVRTHLCGFGQGGSRGSNPHELGDKMIAPGPHG